METLLFLFGGIANMVAVVGGAVAAIFLCWAGIQWMMASGDPQKMSYARSSVLGVLAGLLIIGGSFLIPDAVNQRLIRPATGVNLDNVVGLDCDQVLKRQVIRTRTASDAWRMDALIRHIQSWKEGCNPELWAPNAVPNSSHAGLLPGGKKRCGGPEIGRTDVPTSLQQPGGGSDIRGKTERDADDNIFVVFHDDERPADGARCWLYVSRLKIWDAEW